MQQIGLNVIEDKTKGHDHQKQDSQTHDGPPIIVPEQLYFLWGEGQDAIVGPAFQGVFPVFADEFKAASRMTRLQSLLPHQPVPLDCDQGRILHLRAYLHIGDV